MISEIAATNNTGFEVPALMKDTFIDGFNVTPAQMTTLQLL